MGPETFAGGGLSSAQLQVLFARSGLVGSAVLKGERLFFKAKGPAKVGSACRLSLQGQLTKGRPATAWRTAKIAKGKAKRLVLRVKPKAKAKLAKKRKLHFKFKVKAGKSRATAYKRIKLIRHR